MKQTAVLGEGELSIGFYAHTFTQCIQQQKTFGKMCIHTVICVVVCGDFSLFKSVFQVPKM